MPITYQIDHERRLVDAKADGLISDGDVFAYQREVWSRTDVVGYAEIVDMIAVERIDLPSIDKIRELAELAARMDADKPASKLAIVASRDFAFGLGRMYETYRELQAGSTKPVGVFRTRREALDFLGLEGDLTPPSGA
jgi:hypothetical protein